MRFLALLLALLSLPSFGEKKKVTIAAAEVFSELTDRNLVVVNNVRLSMNMALERYKERLAKKGVEVSFREFDFDRDDLSVLRASREIVKSDVIGSIGFNTSNRALLAAPIHQQSEVPMISTQATATRLGSFGSYVHTASVSNESFAKTLAAVAIDKLKAKRAVSIAAVDCSYCTDLTEAFRDEFKRLGGEDVVMLPILAEQNDFSKLVTELKSKRFDVVLNPNHKLLASRLIVALTKSRIHKPYLFADGWGSLPETLFFKIVGEIPFEGYAVDHWHPDFESKVSKNFVKEFKEKTGTEPDTLAALWFDAASIMLEAISRSKEVNRAEVEKQIQALTNFRGVTGSFAYNSSSVPKKETVLLKAKGRDYSVVGVIPADGPGKAFRSVAR